MDAREERTTHTILPYLSGPMPGVVAVLTTALLGCAVLGSALIGGTSAAPPLASALAAPSAPESNPVEGPIEEPALPPSEQHEVSTGLPPRLGGCGSTWWPVTPCRPSEVVAVDRATGELTVVARGPGDGTVLRSSALMDERVGQGWSPKLRTPIDWSQVSFLFSDHLGMTRDPGFTDNLLYLLLEQPPGPWAASSDSR